MIKLKHTIFVFLLSAHLNTAYAAFKCVDIFSQSIFNIDYLTLQKSKPPGGVRNNAPQRHWAQLDPQSRFIQTEVLKNAYLAPPREIVNHAGDKFEIGIIDPNDPAVALRVSNVLSRSIEMSRASNKGHIPDDVVERVQDLFVSPEAVKKKWALVGNRFVVSKKVSDQDGVTEVLGTFLVTKNHDAIFFLSGNHDNLMPIRNSQGKILYYLDHDGRKIDQNFVNETIGSKFPDLSSYKPDGLYQIVNFAFLPEVRGAGLGKQVLLSAINEIKQRRIDKNGKPLFEKNDGWGFWQVGEPPWQKRMQPMNFSADPSQHVYLVPKKDSSDTIAKTGEMSIIEFNESFDVFSEYFVAAKLILDGSIRSTKGIDSNLNEKLYQLINGNIGQSLAKSFEKNPEKLHELESKIKKSGIKFPERIPELFDLARSGIAKLQYKNLYASFEDVINSGRANDSNKP